MCLILDLIERKRLKSMAHRRDFNNREMEKKREEAQYWKEVKETEMYMRCVLKAKPCSSVHVS